MTLSPARATGWTVAGLAFAYVQSNIVAELLISGSILVSVIFLTRKFKSLVTFWGLSVPFLVPLILLHGFVNPNFTADDSVLGLPFRHSGMNFAISVYSDLAIFFSVAIAWMNVNRDHAFDWLASRPLACCCSLSCRMHRLFPTPVCLRRPHRWKLLPTRCRS